MGLSSSLEANGLGGGMTLFDWPLWAHILFAYVVIQRIAELAYANANTRRLLAEGGREYGADHYPLFIILHTGWLISIALFAEPALRPDMLLLNLFVASQTFRFWTLASIGRWWTTRIISAPHFPTVRRGPYRFIKHPNYALVVVEIALHPRRACDGAHFFDAERRAAMVAHKDGEYRVKRALHHPLTESICNANGAPSQDLRAILVAGLGCKSKTAAH
jgi:methyltransferase